MNVNEKAKFLNEQIEKRENDLREMSKRHRGDFLHRFCALESIMNFIISHHFCGVSNDPGFEFQCIFLGEDGAPMYTKKRSVWFIINKHPEVFKKYKNIDTDLSEIIKFRNVLSHQPLTFCYDGNPIIEEEIKIVYSKLTTKDKKPDIVDYTITENQYKELVKKLDNVIELLHEFDNWMCLEKLKSRNR